MGFRDFEQDETIRLLQHERVVRIAFDGAGDRYLVPVFYVWHEGALCGLTTPGRKTKLAEQGAEVAFQVDTVATTGPWEWSSVTGSGRFEAITDDRQFLATVSIKLQAKLADAPEWAQRALQKRFATLGIVPFRILPSELHGRAHEVEA